MSTDVVDIEGLVKRWAWQMFDATKTKEQGRIPKEHMQMMVNWKRVKFAHSEPDYGDASKPPNPKTQCLFRTFFSNSTDQDQEYSFKTQRTTHSTCEVEIERGFTIGYEMNVSLKTPCEVFEANAGFHKELELVETNGQTFEEEMVWEVDSQIKVPPHHKTTAQLVISEDQYDGTFVVNTVFSGKVTVSITNTRDNNSFVKSVEGNIADIIKRETDNGLKGFVVDKNKVSFKTKGQCKFRFAIEQHVKLSQEALDGLN